MPKDDFEDRDSDAIEALEAHITIIFYSPSSLVSAGWHCMSLPPAIADFWSMASRSLSIINQTPDS